MTAAAALALASLLAGAGELRLEPGLRLEGRGRQLSPRDGADDRTLEAFATPRAALLWLAAPRLRLGGSYAPRFRAPDLTRSSDVVLLHTGEARAELRPDAAWRLSAVASGERGTTDLLTESRTIGTELQTITTTRRLRYQAARAELGLEGRAGPRTELRVLAGAFLDGGEGAAAEATLPIQRGARAEATLTWALTRLDRLGLRLTGRGARLDRGPTSAIATADAIWRRRLARAVDAWAGGGVAGAYEDPRGDTASRDLLPSGEVGISHTPVAPAAPGAEGEEPVRATPTTALSTRLVVRLAPAIDRATGAADPQLEGTLDLTWPVTTRWSLSGAAVGAVARQSGSDTRRARLESQVQWAATSAVHLGLGVYASWQRAAVPSLPSFDESGAFLSLDLAGPTLSP
ncbi:TonB-dependent receptor [Anaeromyxobacter sp. PSR-1]|uniref:TonB-dependent receptor n=1 Tax=unclassified Anaeromyxobacter TaxID=2620896 RepID=UPI0005E291B9|nr:TonB-dependent receptor [Anaeromyxobacter sp. PSR-1]GAO03661.1 hypothetical protein PSR1_02545 [Anaeromyxobacter sp. PSR-1]